MYFFSIINKFARSVFDSCSNFFFRWEIIYVVEGRQWSIWWDGVALVNKFQSIGKKKSRISTTPRFSKNSIIHFGSIHTFLKFSASLEKRRHNSNRYILTWFHVIPDEVSPEQIKKIQKHISLIHTSSSRTKTDLISLGFNADQIVVIPLGVDVNLFMQQHTRDDMRRSLGISKDAFVIGSFQKDGNGWKKGETPKYIKGPDIFCAVVEQIFDKNSNIVVLLTGPARGYVQKRLKMKGIPYIHRYPKKYTDIPTFYAALDLYIVASRIEGGPKAILESWASGIPLVSTDVGMVSDIVDHQKNGYITEIEDVSSLVAYTQRLIDSTDLRRSFVRSGKQKVQDFDWSSIASRYMREIYEQVR